jgi:hypothetical protein
LSPIRRDQFLPRCLYPFRRAAPEHVAMLGTDKPKWRKYCPKQLSIGGGEGDVIDQNAVQRSFGHPRFAPMACLG